MTVIKPARIMKPWYKPYSFPNWDFPTIDPNIPDIPDTPDIPDVEVPGFWTAKTWYFIFNQNTEIAHLYYPGYYNRKYYKAYDGYAIFAVMYSVDRHIYDILGISPYKDAVTYRWPWSDLNQPANNWSNPQGPFVYNGVKLYYSFYGGLYDNYNSAHNNPYISSLAPLVVNTGKTDGLSSAMFLAEWAGIKFSETQDGPEWLPLPQDAIVS